MRWYRLFYEILKYNLSYTFPAPFITSMQASDNESPVVRQAWQAVLDAEKLEDKSAALKYADALENYAKVLHSTHTRILDAANCEAKAHHVRAEYYKSELENDTTNEKTVSLALAMAKTEELNAETRQQKKALEMLPTVKYDPRNGNYIDDLGFLKYLMQFVTDSWLAKAVILGLIVALVCGINNYANYVRNLLPPNHTSSKK